MYTQSPNYLCLLSESSHDEMPKNQVGSAVCVQCHIESQASGHCEFSLTWDMPEIHFGAREQNYYR